MLVRCINDGFRDLAEGLWRNTGDEWEADEERLAEINRAGYGRMAEAVAPAPRAQADGPAADGAEGPWWVGKTRSELARMASERGLDVPPRATKAEIAEILGGE